MELIEVLESANMSALDERARAVASVDQRAVDVTTAMREHLYDFEDKAVVDRAFDSAGVDNAVPFLTDAAQRLVVAVAHLSTAKENAHLDRRMLGRDEYQGLYESVMEEPRAFSIAAAAHDALTEVTHNYLTGQFGENDTPVVAVEDQMDDAVAASTELMFAGGLSMFRTVDNDYEGYVDRYQATHDG